MFQKIPWNAQEDSGECSRRFQRMFKKVSGNTKKDSDESNKKTGNAIKDSGGYSRGFRGMFEKILGNNFNFKLIKATFYLKVNPNKQ